MTGLGIHWAFLSEQWYWFLLIPIMICLIFYSAKRRREILALLAYSPKAQFRAPKNRLLKNILFLVGLLLVIVAYMGPQWGQKPHVVKAEGLDICFALDLSRSMLVEDVSPNRLSQIKNQLAIFLPKLSGDRVAIVAFAGTGYVVTPLSNDYSAMLDFIEPLEPDFISDQSTRLSSGLDSCAEALKVKSVEEYSEIEEEAAKVIVVLSDGEDTVEEGSFSLEQSKKLKIPVFSFSVGSEEGGPVPLYDSRGNVTSYLKEGGEPVLSRVKVEALKELSSETGGKLFYAEEGISAWSDFLDELNGFQRKTQEAGFLLDWEHRFQIFLSIAFLILLLEFLITETRMKIRYLPFLIYFMSLGSLRAQVLDLPKVYYNNQGVGENAEKNFGEAKDDFSKSIEEHPSDLQVQYNWASNLLNALDNEKLDKNETRSEEDIKEIVETFQNIYSSSSDEALKKSSLHQMAQAYEMTEKKKKAIELYYRSMQGVEWPDLDLRSQVNLSRLLLDPQQQGGGGGQGEGGGQGGQGQDKKGDGKVSQKKQQSKYRGTDYSEGEVKKILQSVSSEEKDVQRRKARSEAQKKMAQKDKGEKGQGQQSPQY